MCKYKHRHHYCLAYWPLSWHFVTQWAPYFSFIVMGRLYVIQLCHTKIQSFKNFETKVTHLAKNWKLYTFLQKLSECYLWYFVTDRTHFLWRSPKDTLLLWSYLALVQCTFIMSVPGYFIIFTSGIALCFSISSHSIFSSFRNTDYITKTVHVLMVWNGMSSCLETLRSCFLKND